MIYECTDCSHCADFNGGLRVFCLHPELSPDSVCGYQPVGDSDADNCHEFDADSAHWFTWSQLVDAEDYSKLKYNGEVTYEGMRSWCEREIAKRAW